MVDKNKLLEQENIASLNYIDSLYFEGIIIKYNDKNYKIIDKNNEYLLDVVFNDFMYLNIYSYDFHDKEISVLKQCNNRNWGKLIIFQMLGNQKFGIIYSDYLKFVERIKKLKELGFNNKAI